MPLFIRNGSRRHKRGWLAAVSLALFSLLSPVAALAQCPEEVIENHTGPGTVAVPGFVAGEQGGAVFEAPADHYPLQILRIGVGWGSQLGGAPQSLEDSINIYAGTPPTPGAAIASLAGPVLTDGAINEFNLIDLLPGQPVIIDSGPFLTSLRLANSSTLLGPSMVHDGAGCIPGRSYVEAIPGGWTDLCAFGATGNWVFFVVYQPNCIGPPVVMFSRGDCNSDSGIDIGDAVFLLGNLFTAPEPIQCVDACDANDDGSLDISDVIRMLSFLFDSPSTPFPPPLDCGEDPTVADPLDCEMYSSCP